MCFLALYFDVAAVVAVVVAGVLCHFTPTQCRHIGANVRISLAKKSEGKNKAGSAKKRPTHTLVHTSKPR